MKAKKKKKKKTEFREFDFGLKMLTQFIKVHSKVSTTEYLSKVQMVANVRCAMY